MTHATTALGLIEPGASPEALTGISQTLANASGVPLDVVQAVAGSDATVNRVLDAAQDPSTAFVAVAPGTTPPAQRLVGVGTSLEDLLRRARCPVLVVPPAARAGGGLRRIVVPLDGTPASARVAPDVEPLALHGGAEVLVVHVAETHPHRPAQHGEMTSPRYMDQPHHEWEAWSQEFVARFTPAWSRPIPTRLFVRVGEPAAVIAEVALEQQADLLVVGWSGELASPHASVLHGLLARTPCPLLVLLLPPE